MKDRKNTMGLQKTKSFKRESPRLYLGAKNDKDRNAENTALTDPRPAATQKAAPSKEVMGNGMDSVIHETTTHVRIAANRWAGAGRLGKGIR